ncbi:hypothetical protein JJB11_09125 [Ramlibacter ginsenosidimutans]|uniref:Uncharacterized protein n=1 Tax=Ramlibacter ginsenosidimutans TaxID=502333 RepID=A0A934TRU2_9BURK|nr:hypothetical protein [Ramlibacter ginsenosidimutans]MBK6006249.1 hypothetical protein [Ramlibacter ginsenosidimutans]
MEMLKDPPAAFRGIAQLFDMAQRLPASGRADLLIGLSCAGELFARGVLHGYRQVKFFAEYLRSHGWHEHLLGGDADMLGCDMLFAAPEAAPQDDEDPSFIRRAAMQLWPSEAEHHD